MSRSPRAALLGAALALAVATPAGAAVTVGQLPAAATQGPCSGPGAFFVAQRTLASGTSFVVPAPGGVLTRFRTRNVGIVGTAFRYQLFIPQGNDLIAGPFVAETSSGAAAITTTAARVPVAGGEVLGLSGRANVQCVTSTGQGTDSIYYDQSVMPDPGTFLLAPSFTSSNRVNVEATLEPDADRDGFGDETQDGCPAQAARQAAPCLPDVSLSAAAAEPSVTVGGATTVVLTARAANDVPVSGARVALTVPAGLDVIAVTPSAGTCAAGAVVDCQLGDLPGNGSAAIALVVRTATTGAKTVVGNVSSSSADAAAGNNVATASFDVVPAPAAGGSGGATTPPVRLCRIPSLKGRTQAAAKQALEAAGCRLGKVRKPKARQTRLKVRTQSLPATLQVLAGTKVDVTLRGTPVKARRKGR